MTEALRPALMHPSYWPEVRRGAERLTHDLAVGLRRRGHDPVILTSHRGRPRVSEEDVRVVRVPRPPHGPLHRRAVQEHVTHLPFAYAALLREDPQLAHCLLHTETIAALRWRRRYGRPVVLTFTGLPRRESLANRWGRLGTIERALAGCDAIVAISAAARDAARRWLGVDARLIHPGVDLEAFSPGGDRPAGPPTLLCPSALDDARKRPGLLLAAFERVRAERPPARLVVARPRSTELAGQLEAGGATLADLDGHDTLVSAYRSASVTVLPSHEEAFGLVLAESLACGTPVVGSTDAGAADLIAPGSGEGFDSDDPADLAHAMLRALDLAADTATAARARAHAETFSLDRCAAAHEALYREVLNR